MVDKKTRRAILSLITFTVLLYAAVTNVSEVLGILIKVWGVVKPICIGLIIAFVLNVPMRFFEKLIGKMFKKSKKKPPVRIVYLVSLILAVLSIMIVVSLALTIAVPEIVEASVSTYEQIKIKLPELLVFLEKYNIDTTRLNTWVSTFDESFLVEKVTMGAGELFASIISVATATVSGFLSFLFALVISMYVLVSKDTVIRRAKKLMYSFVKKEIVDKVCYVGDLSSKIFSQYLSGQCIEACILGVLITITFLIFRIPYAGVIGIMTGLSAFIPYVGAFAACFIGAFLILLVSPMQALISIIIFCVVQFIETQFIYPHVVGSSVGLSPLLTLVAALVGGNLMGIFGIVFFIPLTAVVFTLVKEYANKRLEQKRININ